MTLSVWATTKQAYVAVWKQLPVLLRFALVPFVLAIVVPPLAFHLGKPLLAYVNPGVGFLVYSPICNLLGTMAMLPFIVQCYRIFLLGSESVAADSWYRVGRESLSLAPIFAICEVLSVKSTFVAAFLVFPELAKLLDISTQDAWPPALAAVFAVLFAEAYVATRLVFLLPEICLNRRWALPARWRETRGNTMRLLSILVLVLFVPALVGINQYVRFSGDGLTFLIGPYPGYFSFSDWPGPFAWPSRFMLYELIAHAGIGLVWEALLAAAVVIAYAQLTGFAAQGIPALTADRSTTEKA